MSLTKRRQESQPNDQQALAAAQHGIRQAARIINADYPLDWEDREAAGRALADALMRLVELEKLLNADQKQHEVDYYAAQYQTY